MYVCTPAYVVEMNHSSLTTRCKPEFTRRPLVCLCETSWVDLKVPIGARDATITSPWLVRSC